jgi:eukaryotic-like serine/threonine-protein kinase
MWVLPLTPERPGGELKAIPFHQTQFNERNPQFSPDDRWVAYNSDESGRNEIYVSPFSRRAEKHQISLNGGSGPRWRQDGKGIFYAAYDGQLMEADVRISAENAEVGTVRPVFTRVLGTGGYTYDVSADGQRVLAAMPLAKAVQPITLVENWAAALKR